MREWKYQHGIAGGGKYKNGNSDTTLQRVENVKVRFVGMRLRDLNNKRIKMYLQRYDTHAYTCLQCLEAIS